MTAGAGGCRCASEPLASREHEIWSAFLTEDQEVIPAWYGKIVEKHLKRAIWKGGPDPRSKRARNGRSIQKVLHAKNRKGRVPADQKLNL